MADDDFLLRSLIASPEDDDLRCVYADWLEEAGDPRAAFLRAEVTFHKSGRTPELRERLHESRIGLDTRWLALVDRPLNGWRIVRTAPPGRIFGKAIPAFIHNLSYHLTALDVYADGAINCWGFVDLPLFHDKIVQGWVVPGAEVGGTISIHNLGQSRVEAAEWDRSPADFELDVTDLVRELNPTLEGLLDMQGTDTEVRNGARYAKMGIGDGKPFRSTLSGGDVAGAELPVLEVVADGYRLRHWLIYVDGLSQLGYGNELMPLEAVARMFADGRLTLSVPEGTWVTLDGLGRFQAGEGHWYIDPNERVREANDLLDELNGGPGACRRCIDAHEAYEAEPSEERRETLRRAYEAVPEHLRMYCGDMDSKDGPIRRILFGDEGEDGPE